MAEKELIILKIGGSVITDKKNNRKKILKDDLERIASEIAQGYKLKKFSLIIIHGVGEFGHKIAKKFNLKNGYKNKSQIEAISKLYLDLKSLNSKIEKCLNKKGINTVTFQQSSAWKLNNGKIKKYNLNIIKAYINFGFVPVLYGDVLLDDKLGFSVLSGDQIVSYLGKKLKTQRILIGTDIDGVFDFDPRINKKAKLIKKISSVNIDKLSIEKSTCVDVTGGMKGKVNELFELAKYGIESEIINISKPDILKRSLCGGKGLGTIIK